MSTINTRLISGKEINTIANGLIPTPYLNSIFECYPNNGKRIAAIMHGGEFAFEIGDKLTASQFDRFTKAGKAHVSDYDEFKSKMF